MKAPFALCALLACAGAADSFSESLDLFQLPGNFYLANFSFNFYMESLDSERVDYMPLHFVQFAKVVPALQTLQVDLSQGRWDESAIKKITQFSNLQHTLPGYDHAEAGLSLKYYLSSEGNYDGKARLYSLVSSLLSVAVFEQREKEEIELSDGRGRKFKYFSKPYEAFCKENLSFLFKILKAQG